MLKRSYGKLFHQEKYRRIPVFLEFVAAWINDPQEARMQFEAMWSQLVISDSRQEDLQAMGYYSWLKSKMLDRSYYETLLETIS